MIVYLLGLHINGPTNLARTNNLIELAQIDHMVSVWCSPGEEINNLTELLRWMTLHLSDTLRYTLIRCINMLRTVGASREISEWFSLASIGNLGECQPILSAQTKAIGALSILILDVIRLAGLVGLLRLSRQYIAMSSACTFADVAGYFTI